MVNGGQLFVVLVSDISADGDVVVEPLLRGVRQLNASRESADVLEHLILLVIRRRKCAVEAVVRERITF